VASGAATARAVPPNAQPAAAAATLALFLGVSVPLYLDHRWTRPLWKACRARSGRDWMLNSGVLDLDHRRPPTATHLAAGAIFATYPLWLALGWRAGRRAVNP